MKFDMSEPYVKAGVYGGAISAGLSLLGNIPVISCIALPITCIASFALPIGVGYYAAKLANIAKGNNGEAAKLGAMAGAISGAIGGLAGLVIAVIFNLLGFAVNSGLSSLSGSFSGEEAAGTAVGFGAVIFGGICGLAVAVVLNAAFGALGGIINVNMNNSSTTGGASKPETAEEAEVVKVEDKK